MKKGLIYIGGVVTGIVLTVLIGILYAKSGSHTEDSIADERIEGLTIFDEPGECISKKEFEIFQVLAPGVALAHEESDRYGKSVSYHGVMVLLVNDEGRHYYDDQIIKIPAGKCARQIGVYKYTTKAEYEKTVPVVMIME